MRKANALKRLLLFLTSGLMLFGTTPVMAVGNHQQMPQGTDGRPKFMVESIDLHNNKVIFSYLDDGQVGVQPAMVGAAWYEMNRYINTIDTTRIENFEFLTRDLGAVITENDFEQWTEIERDGQLVKYDIGDLEQDLGTYDPTARWMYFVRFDEGANNTFWHGKVVDYTECMIQYRDLAWDMSKEVHAAACVADSYNVDGSVNYVLAADYSEVELPEPEMDWWLWCMENPWESRCRDCMEDPENPECRRCMEDPMAIECRWWEEGSDNPGEDESGGDGEGGVSGGDGGGSEPDGMGGEEGPRESGGGEGNVDGDEGENGESEYGGGGDKKEGGGSGDEGGVDGATGSGENGGSGVDNVMTNPDVVAQEGEVNWDVVANDLGVSLAGYTGNEVEILRASRGGDVIGVAQENVNSQVGGGNDKEREDEAIGVVNGNEVVEVPELNGGKNGDKKMQWWMWPVLGVLTVGAMAWWIVPIIKRRKDEEEEQ